MTTSSDSHATPGNPEPAPAALGRYTLRHCLGQGGMGTVHLAEDTRLRRLVAIKSIREELGRNEEVRKRIERECLLHARIGSHPHIVTLYDRLDEGDRIHLVMEYVEGKTLDDLMGDAQTEAHVLSWKDGLHITMQVLDALSRIHSQNIVHRDIKPSNILVTKSDSGEMVAKLMDFGIARLEDSEAFTTAVTKEGSGGPGTPTYMAPEQIDRHTFGPLSPSTDIYAVGVMLYQLLSGAPPFTGTITEVFHSHLNVEPISLDRVCAHPVPAELTAVLRRALAKHPRDRFDSARAMKDALEQAAHAVSSDAMVYRRATDEKTQMESAKTVAVDPAFGPVAGYEKGATVLTGIGTRMTRRKASTSVLIAATAGVAVLFIAIGAFFMLGRGDSSSEPSTPAPATEPESPTTASTPSDPAVPAQPADPTATAGVPPQPQPVSTVAAQPDSAVDPPPADNASASGGAMAAFLEKRGATEPEPAAQPPATAPAPDASSQQQGSAAAALAASATTPDTPAPAPEPAPAPAPPAAEPPKPKPKPSPVKSEPMTPDNVAPEPEKKKDEPNILEGIQVKTHSEKISN